MTNSQNELSDALRAQTLAYLKGELTDEEKTFFEAMLIDSDALQREVHRSRALLGVLARAGDEEIKEKIIGLIRHAVQTEASHIHMEPGRDGTRVRFRNDGVPYDYEILPREMHQLFVDRWKVAADMDVSERRRPQEGRIPIEHNSKNFDLRVLSYPSLYGEKIVATVLGRSDIRVGLEQLSITSIHLAALKRLAALPSGLVVTSGRAGTGKSTLLYSLLMEIQRDGLRRNIATIEDPIELALGEGATQTAIDRPGGLTYPTALRALLRSDSEVIYCAQTRDLETAELEIEAAVTGRLVLTSLHTASALSIVQRLRDMGIPSFLVADTLVGLVGQRLVRRVDDRQTEEYEPKADELTRLGLTLANGPFRRGIPTEANHQTGFAGRIPLLEVVEVGEALRRRIADGAPFSELQQTAFANGGSLLEDARAKIRAGETTVEEAVRALWDYPRF